MYNSANAPLLTVFIATYNRVDFLPAAIEAVLNQTYKNFKLIVLDNASTDNTGDIVKKYTDPRLSYIRNSENIGGVGNVNKAIDIADTKYFIILHDDDYAAPEMLEKEIAVLESDPDIVIVSTNMDVIRNNHIIGTTFYSKEDIIYHKGEYLIDYAKNNNKISCPTAMFRTDFMKEKKLYIQALVGPAADTYLWMNINLYENKIYVIREPLYYYRIHESQDSKLNDFSMRLQLYSNLEVFYKENGYDKYFLYLASSIYNETKLGLLISLAKNEISYPDYLTKVSLLNSKIKNPKNRIVISILDFILSVSKDFYLNMYKIYSSVKKNLKKIKGC